jgi:hypothetical protein
MILFHPATQLVKLARARESPPCTYKSLIACRVTLSVCQTESVLQYALLLFNPRYGPGIHVGAGPSAAARGAAGGGAVASRTADLVAAVAPRTGGCLPPGTPILHPDAAGGNREFSPLVVVSAANRSERAR